MREISIMDNLNCKTQPHARVCKENKVLEEKNDCPFNKFSLKDRLLEGTQETLKRQILVCLLMMILHSIKILILYLIYQ